jgi:[ribosomal protein S5]-alanine N-acetyltransferase
MDEGDDQLRSASSWSAQVPRLSGESVYVREVVEADADTLFELLSDPRVTEHLSSPPPSAAAFAGFIQWAHAERAAGRGVCFGIVPHGIIDAVGIIQVRAIGLTCATSEWGFAIGASFWSTGVFVEAANLVAEFAFTTMGVNRLEARAVGVNGRGNGVLQKLGADPEANLAAGFRKQGRAERQLLWSLREEAWRQRPLMPQRFSSTEAAAKISRAIGEAMQRASERTAADAQPTSARYPFFLTDVE